MSLSTTQYGYIIDPLVPLTDGTGRTISNGYVRVFVAGTSTPVITYANFDGTANQETVQLDNSGRTAYPVIGSKGSTYKVCVYDAEHSQETPIKTIDKVVPTGASVNATNTYEGLNDATGEGWVSASVVGGSDLEMELDATAVSSEVDDMIKASEAGPDYMIPLVHKNNTSDDKKIKLGNLIQFVLDFISYLATTITSFANGDYFVVGRSTGAAKMSKDSLLLLTAQNALASNIAPAFDPSKAVDPDTGFAYNVGESVIYNGEIKMFVNGHTGAWVAADAVTIQLPRKFATSEVMQRLLGNRLDDSQFTKPGRYIGVDGVATNDNRFGDSGLCPCIAGEILYFFREGDAEPNKFYNPVCFYDEDGHFLTSRTSYSTIRTDLVPNGAYFFSVPIRYDDGVPVRMVVSCYLTNKFIPYSRSREKIDAVVDDNFVAENLFDPSAITEGKYITGLSNGQEVWTTDASKGESDFIPVRNGPMFCWYDYITPNNMWPFIQVMYYDSSKAPILYSSVGSGQPEILQVPAGTRFIRIAVTLSHKNEISVGWNKFTRFVPYGGLHQLTTSDVVQNLGNDDKKVMSQMAVTEALADVVVEPSEFDLDLTGCETDIIAVARNYILKEFEESGTRYFEFSNDGGKTFARSQNTIGAITFIHFFSTGRAIVCGTRNVYYTDDFSSFTETSVYDYDGTPYTPNVDSYYRLGNYNSEYYEIDGKEVLVWNDYNVASGYNSRVWLTDDYGVTLKCILKDASTLDDDGNVIDVSHFHRTYVDASGKIYVTSGDVGDLCKLIVGNKDNSSWSWHVIGKGDLYKLSQMMIKHPYAIFITDYTGGQNPTGLVCCPVSGLDDPQNFRYVYKDTNNNALSKYFEDDNGYRLIFPDGIGTRKFWFANGNFDFRELSITGGTGNIVLDNIYGPAYNEQVICVAHTNGYGVATNPTLTGYPRFDLGKAMRNAGFVNFGKIRKFFERLQ